MSYVSHDLLGKTVSRLDSAGHSCWPFGVDVAEAEVVAVWITSGAVPQLMYAVKTDAGVVDHVYAVHVRLGKYVPIKQHDIVCPKCSALVGRIYDGEKRQGLGCYNCNHKFDWVVVLA